jgi:hypothetical protein
MTENLLIYWMRAAPQDGRYAARGQLRAECAIQAIVASQ